jgi:hypothetical protein
VDNGTHGDVAQRQVVAGLDVGAGAGLNNVALLQLGRSKDVTLGAINVVQQCDTGGAVRIIFDLGTLAGTPSLS